MRELAYAAAFVAITTTAGAQDIRSQEPRGIGSLAKGQVVYVDNGQCGKGRLLKVTGGYAANRVVKPRTHACVPDPRKARR
jgi:hypothetical protein